jgi:hypothetical protein
MYIYVEIDRWIDGWMDRYRRKVLVIKASKACTNIFQALVRRCSGTVKPLLRRCYGSIKALSKGGALKEPIRLYLFRLYLLRLYEGSMKALLRLY